MSFENFNSRRNFRPSSRKLFKNRQKKELHVMLQKKSSFINRAKEALRGLRRRKKACSMGERIDKETKKFLAKRKKQFPDDNFYFYYANKN